MHQAPTVSFPVTRSWAEGLVWLGVSVLALGACLLWALGHPQPGWRWQLFLGLSLLSLLGGLWRWRHAPSGILMWNGQAWSWLHGQAEVPVHAQVRLDFQSVLLLELRPMTGRSVWLWLQPGPAAHLWTDLRRALHAQSQQTLAGDATAQTRGGQV